MTPWLEADEIKENRRAENLSDFLNRSAFFRESVCLIYFAEKSEKLFFGELLIEILPEKHDTEEVTEGKLCANVNSFGER